MDAAQEGATAPQITVVVAALFAAANIARTGAPLLDESFEMARGFLAKMAADFPGILP